MIFFPFFSFDFDFFYILFDLLASLVNSNRESLNLSLILYASKTVYKHVLKDLENLAFRRPTWLSASWGGYTSEKAVDGRKTNRHYADGPCTVSPDIQEVTWRVDLQRIRKIEYIRIYFRTDNRPFGEYIFLKP